MESSSSGRRSTSRVLRVLTHLAARPEPLSASSIADALEIPKQTLYPMLADMARLGFVSYFPEEHRWGLGVAAFEIGAAYLRAAPLQRLGGPVLDRLSTRVGETSHLAVLHGNEALYLIKHVPLGHPPHLITDVGVRLPAHLTAVGRAILASLPPSQIRALYPVKEDFVQRTGHGITNLKELSQELSEDRQRGYSLESDLTSDGVTCIAASVHDHDGRPVAAVGVSFMTERHHPDEWTQLAERVRQAADAVTARIHGQPTADKATMSHMWD